MIVALLVLHGFVTVAMIGLILLQKSDSSGPFGVGGGQNSLFTARGVANILTRTTSFLAALFIGNCLLIGVLTDREMKSEARLFDNTVKEPEKKEETNAKETEVAPSPSPDAANEDGEAAIKTEGATTSSPDAANEDEEAGEEEEENVAEETKSGESGEEHTEE
jgi:preprotein translocase subunit SecG